ncbi:MAG: glutamate racemase [Halofilum sp. (in: g-proteobacteria)]
MAQLGPIGVFDSGFGGLSVLRAIRAALPEEHLLYCADHALFPYGEREAGAVLTRSRHVADALVAGGAKAIVVACNTATAVAADALRAELTVPVIGMEPAVKPAAAATRNGVIGVLGTGGTLASARFAGLLERYAGEVDVITRRCPELVEAAEDCAMSAARRQALVDAAVAPLLEAGADVVVLGCTHFAFLRAEIARAVGPSVDIIDTGPAVARELARRLEAEGMLRGGSRRGSERFWTSGERTTLEQPLAALWGGAELETMPQRPAAEQATG